MKQELLAPAGDIEAGYAALYYGADAIYLGLQHFSARATATNFDEEKLGELTGYAHSLGRKIYVALNTLLQETDLSNLLKSLDICVRCHVDALIVQDLGVAHVVKSVYPELELHASTQMAIHNKEGALALQKAGFSRIVLARELSLREIKEIASIPHLETEAFIHGALCYSYSGLCLFSSLESGRSANRGKCLYPCRAEFGGEDGLKHYFSMKDMALEEDVLKLPVTSLKIEGRKKTALYVAAVTDYYRRLLDGEGKREDLAENIQQIFARPWCEFHFNGKNKDVIDRDFVGHRGLLIGKIEQAGRGRFVFRTHHRIERHDGIQIDIDGQEKPFGFSVQNMRVKGKNVFEAKSGDEVEILLPPKAPFLKTKQNIYLASASRVKGAYDYTKPRPHEFSPKQKVDICVGLSEHVMWAQHGDWKVSVNGDFDKASNPQKTREAVEKSFAKSGTSGFELGELHLENPQGLFAPMSLINDLRRQFYEGLILETKERTLPPIDAYAKERQKQWIIRTDQASVLKNLDFSKIAEVIFMLSPDCKGEEWNNVPHNKIRLALPALCRHPQQFVPLVEKLLAQGYRKWEIGNYWGLTVLPENGIDLSFDCPLYTLNSQAMAQAQNFGAKRITLSVEDTLENWQELSIQAPLPIVVPMYQDVPLFTSAACIRSNACKDCPRGEKWMALTKDGKKFDVLSKNCQTMMFAHEPLYFGVEGLSVPADFYRIDFMYRPYTSEEADKIISDVMAGREIKGSRQGNLHRNL